MSDFIGYLVELLARIWYADSQMRDRSLLGESERDKETRRFIGWFFGSAIVIW